MRQVTVEDALKHPNWSMGKKITIDSATMVNKGLEVMEAKWLFDVDFDEIQVVVQPKERDPFHGAVYGRRRHGPVGDAGYEASDPVCPLLIRSAGPWPENGWISGALRKSPSRRRILRILTVCPLLIRQARAGGSMPTVFNAANEWAVARFLKKEIPFLAITDMIESAMGHHKKIEHPSLNEILETETETYDWLQSRCEIGKGNRRN